MNYSTTEDQLHDLFGQYGTVLSVKIITDRETNRPKGFGFIEMEEDDAAEAAIADLDGKEYDGRNLRVNIALERKPRQNNYRY